MALLLRKKTLEIEILDRTVIEAGTAYMSDEPLRNEEPTIDIVLIWVTGATAPASTGLAALSHKTVIYETLPYVSGKDRFVRLRSFIRQFSLAHGNRRALCGSPSSARRARWGAFADFSELDQPVEAPPQRPAKPRQRRGSRMP
jgi:hypothetical protein